jgi:hypothetical protein
MAGRSAGVLGVLAALGLTGCAGSAVLIGRTASGGVIGLDGDREQAMADARRVMSDTCEGAYTITGARTVSGGVFRGRTISEWQLRFTCGANPDAESR